MVNRSLCVQSKGDKLKFASNSLRDQYNSITNWVSVVRMWCASHFVDPPLKPWFKLLSWIAIGQAGCETLYQVNAAENLLSRKGTHIPRSSRASRRSFSRNEEIAFSRRSKASSSPIIAKCCLIRRIRIGLGPTVDKPKTLENWNSLGLCLTKGGGPGITQYMIEALSRQAKSWWILICLLEPACTVPGNPRPSLMRRVFVYHDA